MGYKIKKWNRIESKSGKAYNKSDYIIVDSIYGDEYWNDTGVDMFVDSLSVLAHIYGYARLDTWDL